MNEEIRELEPKALWNYFTDLNAVPRPSKKEERVIQFMKDFGNSLDLETIVDEIGNVIIKKPATPGMENRQTVLLQSHLDMVHQKNADTTFDFDKQGIEMFVEGDWVKAKGTTLGADNGIGVATIMALLAANDIPHPPLEALFTIDEETGMTGALGLKGGMLETSIMLNLDTEDDTELTIGCAGRVALIASSNYQVDRLAPDMQGLRIKISGLHGGHSGLDIHCGYGNAIKILFQLLDATSAKYSYRIIEVQGGGQHNVIPREAFAEIAVPVADAIAFVSEIEIIANSLRAACSSTDSALQVTCQAIPNLSFALPINLQQALLHTIVNCPNSVYSMSPQINGLVQTSSNLAHLSVGNNRFEAKCLIRSSVDTEKMELAHQLKKQFESMGAVVTLEGSYSGWSPTPDAGIIKLLISCYKQLNGVDPIVTAIHAGLECGIIGGKYRDGRSPENPSINYGTGGMLHGKKYMLTTSWNAPDTAFTLPGEFFMQKSVDEGPLFGFHRMNAFTGMQPLESIHFHDVEKNAKIEQDIQRYQAHLDRFFWKPGGNFHSCFQAPYVLVMC